MIKYNRLIKELEVELTTNCNLHCPQCARQNGSEENPFLKHNEIGYDLFKERINREDLQSLELISFCGNFGDSIIAKDVKRILAYCKENSSCLHLGIHTNGSLRNEAW